MKPFAPVFWLALGLSLAGLMAGCATSDYRRAQRIEPASDIEVVETSARRPLTTKEMSELRGTVARYLDKQGQTGSGDYYLKVYLTPEAEGVTPEWVVVRFTRYSDVRVNVASAYPAYDDQYSSSYYSYDTYPYGYDGFGRISFQYYDDPFYGRSYYYPRCDHRDHDHDHHNPGDHKPGDRPPGRVGANPPPRSDNHHRRPPDQVVLGAPRPETAVTFSRPGNPPTPSRTPEPDRPWRGQSENSGRASSPPRSEARNDSRPSPPTYQPPPAQPAQSSSSNSSSSDRREGRDDGKRGGVQP